MREARRQVAVWAAHVYILFIRNKRRLPVTLGILVLFVAAVGAGPATVAVWKIGEVEIQDLAVMQTMDEPVIHKLSDRLCVMLDAGHGGWDPGANYRDIYEKDITLAVTKKVQKLLEKQHIQVIMTREDDTYVDKYDRAHMANDQNVDLFLSIHVNDLKQEDYSGIETYCGWRKLAGKQFAQCVHENTVSATGAEDLGVACANYVVVKYTKMPGALIEIGYLSNAKERKKLTSQAYQQMLAQGIADGVISYAKDNLGYTQP